MNDRNMNDKDIKKYSRQIMLEEIGMAGQEKLMNSTVGIVGAGGLGCPTITALAAMGVRKLVIIDRDIVDSTNLHRQTIYTEDDVGESKAHIAAEKTARRYGTETVPKAVSVNDANARDVLKGCDVVIDALDGVDVRYAVNRACLSLGIPLVSGAAVTTRGQVFTIIKGSPCYRCVFSKINVEGLETCSLDGVHPAALLLTSSVQIGEAVRIITGRKPVLADRIMRMETETHTNIKIPTSVNESCIDCGSNKQDEPVREETKVETLCSRASGGRSFVVIPADAMDIDLAKSARKMFVNSKFSSVALSSQKTVLILRDGKTEMSLVNGGACVATGFETAEDVLAMYNSIEMVT